MRNKENSRVEIRTKANGPIPWEKETIVAHVIAENFQKGLQFCMPSAPVQLRL
jgi:hypothetical protein